MQQQQQQPYGFFGPIHPGMLAGFMGASSAGNQGQGQGRIANQALTVPEAAAAKPGHANVQQQQYQPHQKATAVGTVAATVESTGAPEQHQRRQLGINSDDRNCD